MRIAVIDDEKYSRVELIHQIRSVLPEAEVVEAGNGAQALGLLERDRFDLLFIDVHLGDLEGTTVAALARKLMPKAAVVFATAYSEYAVKAFELRAHDYILKPFDPERIRQVLEECAAGMHGAPAQPTGRLAVHSNRHTILLDTADVSYVETDGSGRGCLVHTLGGEAYPDGSSLSEYEARLSAQGFFRIHKSCLVQLRHIQDIFPWNGSSFALRVRGSSAVLPIGRDRVKELRRLLSI
ncbi:MAG: LytTR family DNA-binding domain-containing protein [Oscillospiraceae bacterium]|nr:LytTR family DNA-binding domain-containing protein [Oscillospiraceae bacterium]